MMELSTAPPIRSDRKLAWLTAGRCRAIFAVLIVANFALSWRYLTVDCPLDLSGDEAQYWDWSRHLDLCYYSKGPMVAYLIRASCFFLGDSMPAVRLPALLLTIGTAICTYWLTRRLFGSDRLALGVVLLSAIVPLYAVGTMLMTIDPPFFFFWALSTCLAAAAIFDDRRWAWQLAGVTAGLGVLTKYSMLEWPLFVLLFLAIDRPSRSKLKTAGPWVMALIALASLTPVVIWNAEHQWVSLHHVTAQIGAGGHQTSEHRSLLAILASPLDLLLSQFAAVNPFLAILMVAGVIWAFASNSKPHLRTKTNADSPRRHGEHGEEETEHGHAPQDSPAFSSSPSPCPPCPRGENSSHKDAKAHHIRAMRFLVCIGGSFFAVCVLDSLKVKTQANWPAPSYFTLLILTGYFIATHWRFSRGWLIAAMVFGLAMQPILHDMTRLYPLAPWLNRHFPKPAKAGEPRYWQAKNLDAEYKMRGISDPFASTVAADLATLPPGSFVLCEAYEDASQLAFYLPGQPKTYFAGSYWTQPFPIRRRWTQFDIWPDRALDRAELKGKDAIYIGTMAYEPLRQSFASVQQMPDITLRLRGVGVTSWTVWKCKGFKGMVRPPDDGTR